MTTLPYEFAQRQQVLLADSNAGLTLYYVPPLSLAVVNEVQRLAGGFRACAVDADTLAEKLDNHYQQQTASEGAGQAWDDLLSAMSDLDVSDENTGRQSDLLSESDSPIVRYINLILNEAIALSASDVHIEVFDSHLSVRVRVDGVLRQMNTPPKHLATMLIARIKVMADLDIAEKRLPQDGRILLERGQRRVDVRVSIVPTAHGERAVLRLLDQSAVNLDLQNLGMNAYALAKFQQLLAKPHGIILLTGPTGSGKTTTLYAGLSTINQAERNILTVEDPVEYDLPGVGQIPVNLATHMTFAKGLRAILRQDPDVVMIGEIRDEETAQIAVQASLTGHLVLSTLHTNTALGAVTRLKDMGMAAYHLSESLTGLMAQRLLRRLCAHCRRAVVLSASDCQRWQLPRDNIGQVIYQAGGCEACADTGYSGRVAVYEIVLVDDGLRRLIHDQASEEQLVQYARQHAPAIVSDALDKVYQGISDMAEVQRVITGAAANSVATGAQEVS